MPGGATLTATRQHQQHGQPRRREQRHAPTAQRTPLALGNAQLTALAARTASPTRHAIATLQRQAGNAATAAFLDTAVRANVSVQRDVGDIRIKGLFPERAKHPDEIYFDYAKHQLDPTEEAKLADIVARAGVDTPVTLQGSASEEGTKGGNKSTIDQRIAQVSKALRKAGHKGPHTPDPQAPSEGTIDYRSQRKVKVVHPKAVGDDCTKDPGVKCGKEVAAAFKRADELINAARTKMNGPLSSWGQTFQGFYESQNVVVRLLVQLQMSALQTFINNAAKQEAEPGKPKPSGPNHRCENACKDCSPGFVAVTSAPNVLFCPPFSTSGGQAGVASDPAEFRAHVLMHESCHGALGAEDRSKVNERAFPHLGTFDALKNADSLVGLIRELVTPGQLSKGLPTPDTGAITPEITEALAFTHKWAQLAGFETNSVYQNGFKIRNEPDGWDFFNAEGATRLKLSYSTIAKEFPPMTPPPKAPNVNDRQRLAAVHDRFDRMGDTLNRSIDAATGGSVVVWSKGPGTKVTFPAKFSTLSLGDRCRAILRALAKQTDGISAEAVEKYVRMAPVLTNVRTPGFAPL